MGNSGGPEKAGGVNESGTLNREGNQLLKESKPLRRELLRQTGLSLLGRPGQSQIPLVQRGLEASRSGTARSVRNLDARFSQLGIQNTPFAETIRANTQLEGDLQSSLIPTQTAAAFASQAPSLALGFPSLGLNAINQSGQLELTRRGQTIGAFTGLVGSALGGAAGACWVAEVLFGPAHRKTYAARKYVASRRSLFAILYHKYGESWAKWLRRHEWAKPLVRPIWERLARKGKAIQVSLREAA